MKQSFSVLTGLFLGAAWAVAEGGPHLEIHGQAWSDFGRIMNFSLAALFQGARRALAEGVMPETTSDHARAQLAGVLDILGKLEGMVVWSPQAQAQQLAGAVSVFKLAQEDAGPREPASGAVLRQPWPAGLPKDVTPRALAVN